MKRHMLRRSLMIGLIAFAPVSGVGALYADHRAPLFATGQDVPDAAMAGDPGWTMQHSAELLQKYREAGWDKRNMAFADWLLPDRQYAELADYRGDHLASYCVPDPQRTPMYRDIAFYTDLYVRRNVSRYPDGTVKSRPSGFYIVAWKSGDITQVPVRDMRTIRDTDGVTELMVLPGMAEYVPSGPKLPFVRAAAPPDDAVARAIGHIRSRSMEDPRGTVCKQM